jgi:hypothetical protein
MHAHRPGSDGRTQQRIEGKGEQGRDRSDGTILAHVEWQRRACVTLDSAHILSIVHILVVNGRASVSANAQCLAQQSTQPCMSSDMAHSIASHVSCPFVLLFRLYSPMKEAAVVGGHRQGGVPGNTSKPEYEVLYLDSSEGIQCKEKSDTQEYSVQDPYVLTLSSSFRAPEGRGKREGGRGKGSSQVDFPSHS